MLGDGNLGKCGEIGISTVKDFKYATNKLITQLMNNGLPGISNCLDMVKEAQPRSKPYTIINHYIATDGNSNRSRCGDNWREEIVKATWMRAYACVTYIVEYMMRESARVMRGTLHLNDCFLSQCSKPDDGEGNSRVDEKNKH